MKASMTLASLLLIGLVVSDPVFAAEAPQQPGVGDDSAELWDRYFEAREGGRSDDALEMAIRLRDLAEAENGNTSTEYAVALAEVGISRLLREDHDLAYADLTLAEDLLAGQLPLYSEKLIRALTFLGASLSNRGRYDEALQAYSRAQHITHRQWGTENDAQIPLTYAKADVLQALGDRHLANEQQQLAVKLHRVNHGETSPQAIAAAARYGTWLRSLGEYDGAIAVFHEALSEVQGRGPDRPESLPLLRGMAHAYRGGYRGKFARGMYERIIELMESQPEAFSVDQRVEARLVFGDWLMQRYFERQAVAQYEAAYAVAAAAGPDGAHWLPQFAEPQLVRYGDMAPFKVAGDDRQVTFQFRVTDDGRIRSAKVSETSAGSRDSSRARQQFPKLTRYRPAIVDGKARGEDTMTTTMYLLPDGVALEPEPVAAPARLTSRDAVAVSNWTLLRGPDAMTLDINEDD